MWRWNLLGQLKENQNHPTEPTRNQTAEPVAPPTPPPVHCKDKRTVIGSISDRAVVDFALFLTCGYYGYTIDREATYPNRKQKGLFFSPIPLPGTTLLNFQIQMF